MKSQSKNIPKRYAWIVMVLFALGIAAYAALPVRQAEEVSAKIRVYSWIEKGYVLMDKVAKSDEEWKKLLTPEAFKVTRKKGTERAFSGQYWNHKEKGVYQCIGCDLDIFSSGTKFESGTGWPSFWEPVAEENIKREEDRSFFMRRTEVLCPRCDSHLGHVFDDGPQPTGLRYCINSVSLKFLPASEEKKP